MLHKILVSLAGALVLAAPAPARDRVELKDGKVHVGRVVHEGRDSIVLRENKKDRTIPRSEIATLVTIERSIATLLDRTMPDGNAEALATVANECEKAGLAAEARLVWLRVLLADPKFEPAIRQLDARATKDDVTVHFGREQRKLSQMRETQARWTDAYELQTTHFVLRTDAALQRALDLGLELERFHKIFYDLLGAPLELYVFDERELPEIRVYAGTEGVPGAPAPGQRVWFAPGDNCLHVLADKPVDVPSVVAELSRQMLFSSMRRSAGPTAQVPMWVATGIAEYFASAVPADRTQPWPSPEAPSADLFALAAKTDVPFDRVFRAPANEFTDGPNARAMSACAYTMLHFFTHGQGGALRPAFGRYVHEGSKGKLSMGALSKQVDMKEAEMEKAWREHVAANAK